MSEKIFYGKTEMGELVEITLSSLMNAKWDFGGEIIRTASNIGMVEILVKSISDVDGVTEIKRLRETLDDYYDAVKIVMDEECPEDERHCSCVPVLRDEIARLRIALEVITNVPSHYLTACEKRMKTIAKEALH